MAISNNRLDFKTISDLNNLNYQTAVDEVRSNANANINSINKLINTSGSLSDVFSKQVVLPQPLNDVASLITCNNNTNVPKAFKLNMAGLNNNRNLNSIVFNTTCKINISALDKILTNIPIVNDSFNFLDNTLEAKATQLIESVGINLTDGYLANFVNRFLTINDIKSILYSNIGALGFSIGAKLNLNKMTLSSNSKLTFNSTPAVNTAISLKTTSTILNTMAAAGVTEMLLYTTGLINNNVATAGDIAGALVDSMNVENDTNVLIKLAVLSNIVSTYNVETKISNPVIATKVVKNINAVGITNSSPIKDFNSISNSLANIDPNWNADSVAVASINNSVTNSNNGSFTLTTLASQGIMNKSTTDTQFDGTYKTNLDTATTTAILGAMSGNGLAINQANKNMYINGTLVSVVSNSSNYATTLNNYGTPASVS